jgi:hypothetical protein
MPATGCTLSAVRRNAGGHGVLGESLRPAEIPGPCVRVEPVPGEELREVDRHDDPLRRGLLRAERFEQQPIVHRDERHQQARRPRAVVPPDALNRPRSQGPRHPGSEAHRRSQIAEVHALGLERGVVQTDTAVERKAERRRKGQHVRRQVHEAHIELRNLGERVPQRRGPTAVRATAVEEHDVHAAGTCVAQNSRFFHVSGVFSFTISRSR